MVDETKKVIGPIRDALDKLKDVAQQHGLSLEDAADMCDAAVKWQEIMSKAAPKPPQPPKLTPDVDEKSVKH